MFWVILILLYRLMAWAHIGYSYYFAMHYKACAQDFMPLSSVTLFMLLTFFLPLLFVVRA